MEKAIVVDNVTKKYRLYNTTKERVLDLLTPKSYGVDFYALRNVNFEANRGDAIGFIGVNGSGKSTLSNIIAGIVPETMGSIKVNGQASLIAVAAGLKADLTGRDNIELKCLMLGFNKEEIKKLEPAIIEFSELGRFIDQPVKSYSSGMRSRLGFAISVNVDPDILIIDEALSVGDRAFAEKSLAKMKEFKEQDKTMIFVSHSIGQMKEFCEKILWLEYGMVKAYGTVDEVIPKYEEFLNQWKKMSKEQRENYKKYALQSDEEGLGKLMQDVKEKSKENEVDLEKPISLLGHIKSDKTFIYPDHRNTQNIISSEEFTHSVYYIKKQVKHKGELFYLLSEQASAQKGVIGWMKATDVSVHSDVAIDNDTKIFYLTGKGSGFNKPWGGRKNSVYSELTLFKGFKFEVDQTKKVGNNLWYHGTLENNKVWIHNSYLEKKV